VHENGEWLAALDGPQYQVRAQGDGALLHFWGSQRSLVRRVVRVAEQSPERVVLEVSRFGRARSAKLEFLAAAQTSGKGVAAATISLPAPPAPVRPLPRRNC